MKKNNKIEKTLCCRQGWLEEKKKDDLVKREQNQSNKRKQKMKGRERALEVDFGSEALNRSCLQRWCGRTKKQVLIDKEECTVQFQEREIQIREPPQKKWGCLLWFACTISYRVYAIQRGAVCQIMVRTKDGRERQKDRERTFLKSN